MDIKKLLFKTLNIKTITNLTVDNMVHYLHIPSISKEGQYVEYEILSEYGEDYGDGKELLTTYRIQVDIFGYEAGDKFFELEEEIRKAMLSNGFIKENVFDAYEKDTKLYHKALRFNITL
ncbi:prohead protease [Clostridium perfringens]|uniref:prohead protease n=1 Tax=Clostridium perfringens TaxID=1502 RepID=UPI0018D773FF|nr:prohead protease [Clostridium perfringens]MCR1963945.1 prohead protease [Clostridium perfringens]QPR51365.1 prohead protease [Clostridium perfringens]